MGRRNRELRCQEADRQKADRQRAERYQLKAEKKRKELKELKAFMQNLREERDGLEHIIAEEVTRKIVQDKAV